MRERRYTSLRNTAPAEAEHLYALAEGDAKRRYSFMSKVSELYEPPATE